jgi:hypothetical protein
MSDQTKEQSLLREVYELMDHALMIARAIDAIKAAPQSEPAKKIVLSMALEEGVSAMTTLSLARGGANPVAELLREMATAQRPKPKGTPS